MITLDVYTEKVHAVENWIDQNGGINLHPTRTIGQFRHVAERAGVALTLDEIEEGQRLASLEN